MRLINFGIKPQVLPPSRVYKPDVLRGEELREHQRRTGQDKVRPEVWKRNAQHLTNAAKNVKGAVAAIGGTHIDFSRSMKIPEHMNGDNLKMKINPEVEKKAKEAADKFLHKFRK